MFAFLVTIIIIHRRLRFMDKQSAVVGVILQLAHQRHFFSVTNTDICNSSDFNTIAFVYEEIFLLPIFMSFRSGTRIRRDDSCKEINNSR